jgi:hypothetical protein
MAGYPGRPEGESNRERLMRRQEQYLEEGGLGATLP